MEKKNENNVELKDLTNNANPELPDVVEPEEGPKPWWKKALRIGGYVAAFALTGGISFLIGRMTANHDDDDDASSDDENEEETEE